MKFLTILIPLLALILFLIFLLWHGWQKFSILKLKAAKELRLAKKAFQKEVEKSLQHLNEFFCRLDSSFFDVVLFLRKSYFEVLAEAAELKLALAFIVTNSPIRFVENKLFGK